MASVPIAPPATGAPPPRGDMGQILVIDGSGSGLINVLEDMELLGADRTIPKPFTPKELIAAVNAVLRC